MKQLERIKLLTTLLRKHPMSTTDLISSVAQAGGLTSVRQLQRDLKDIEFFLSENESVSAFRKGKNKFFFIQATNSLKTHDALPLSAVPTNFYKRLKTPQTDLNLNTVERAIFEEKSILITELYNDETGDNADFEAKNILLQPMQLLFHRESYYVAGFNQQKKSVQIFGINQMGAVQLGKPFKKTEALQKVFTAELRKRFGITRNIDAKSYKIVLEVSSVLGFFIKSHHWHPTQRVTKRNGNFLIHLECGINRELLGWIFQWLYNIRVVEPPILQHYYENTLRQMHLHTQGGKQLVYKNIFENRVKG